MFPPIWKMLGINLCMQGSDFADPGIITPSMVIGNGEELFLYWWAPNLTLTPPLRAQRLWGISMEIPTNSLEWKSALLPTCYGPISTAVSLVFH